MTKISELLLAAPDINAEIFRSEIAPKLVEMQQARKTIFASSEDLALRASKIVHGFRRVGETLGGVFTFPGIDTVIVSEAAPLARAFGHSYVFDSTVVLNDIQETLVWHRTGVGSRRSLGTPPNNYWDLR